MIIRAHRCSRLISVFRIALGFDLGLTKSHLQQGNQLFLSSAVWLQMAYANSLVIFYRSLSCQNFRLTGMSLTSLFKPEGMGAQCA